MFRKMKVIVIALAGTVAGVMLAQQPAIQGMVRQTGNTVSGLVNPGPEAELAKSKAQLEQSLETFAASRTKLATQLDSVSEKADAREQERLQVEVLLARFKEEYAAGQSGGFPRSVFNRSYSADQMEQQVEKLLVRQAELQPEEDGTSTRLRDALTQIDSRISETRRHIENMPVYEALAVAGDAVGKSDVVLADLRTCLNENQAFLTSSPVRDTDELVRQSEVSSGSIMSAREFLKPIEVAAPSDVSEDAPTISELQDALRGIAQNKKDSAK